MNAAIPDESMSREDLIERLRAAYKHISRLRDYGTWVYDDVGDGRVRGRLMFADGTVGNTLYQWKWSYLKGFLRSKGIGAPDNDYENWRIPVDSDHILILQADEFSVEYDETGIDWRK